VLRKILLANELLKRAVLLAMKNVETGDNRCVLQGTDSGVTG
jgi:hypothetical protein